MPRDDIIGRLQKNAAMLDAVTQNGRVFTVVKLGWDDQGFEKCRQAIFHRDGKVFRIQQLNAAAFATQQLQVVHNHGRRWHADNVLLHSEPLDPCTFMLTGGT